MLMIKLVDARKGLHEKCLELFRDEKIAESIYMYLCDGIEECDEVELERKKGRWIMTHDYFTGESIYYAKCSICGEDSLEEGNYCHNCGAKMIEPQESEG